MRVFVTRWLFSYNFRNYNLFPLNYNSKVRRMKTYPCNLNQIFRLQSLDIYPPSPPFISGK